jgi:hypothetical protein
VPEEAAEKRVGVVGEAQLALRIVEDVPAFVPGGEVEVVARGPTSLRRAADEGRDEAVDRSGLLDGEFQQVRLVGGCERIRKTCVDLPLRGVVLMVHADEREPEPADVVLHLTDDAAGIGPRVHPIDEPGRRLVRLQPAFWSPAQQEELELVADGDAEALVLGCGDPPAQDVPGVGFEGLPV